MKSTPNQYDYIIAGAGCAGLSLLYRLLKEPSLNKKRILVIDKSEKKDNDRTWCYWEKGPGLFESIVHHQWKKLAFYTEDLQRQFELAEHRYKMILGIDFYNYVFELSNKFENVFFKKESIITIEEKNSKANLTTDLSEYSADYIFNSTPLFHPEINMKNSLLQHFEGWVIKTKEANFDDSVGTLMDFRLNQKNGDTFMYVLPTSQNEALVEYTLFSPKLLDKQDYKSALANYISNQLKIDEYEILHTEFGVIPMSLAKFKRNENSKRIVNIGTAGGFTKASSGYTFQFIQKNSNQIVKNLLEGNSPIQKTSFEDKVFDWYDRTLLDVILNHKLTGKEIFAKMFKKLPPENILTFLDNESTLLEEIKVMSSLPILPFLTSGIKQLKS